jgi:hypothetical protein
MITSNDTFSAALSTLLNINKPTHLYSSIVPYMPVIEFVLSTAFDDTNVNTLKSKFHDLLAIDADLDLLESRADFAIRCCFDKSGGFIFNTTSSLEEATDWLWHKNACIIIRKCKEMINFGIRDMV